MHRKSYSPSMLARFITRYVPCGPLKISRQYARSHSTVLSQYTHSLIKRASLNANQNVIQRVALGSRTLFTSSIPPALIPPAIFIGLLLTLWTWKCFWIIVMQNKLLYLSWLPPFSRSEKISDYERECKPVLWQEKRIQSLDGTRLSICEGHIPADTPPESAQVNSRKKLVVICYFQGNGGSMPLRLPLLSQFLSSIVTRSKTSKAELDETNYIVVGLSYRGYWTSSGTATQSGIERDALAFLTWVSETYSAPDTDCQMVLWGHSLGAAVASSTVSKYLAHLELPPSGNRPLAPISGLVMEAPISNIKDMLIALYPQKWLPYRYLWPFSWNTWCSLKALEQLAELRNRGASPLPAKSSLNSTHGGPVRSLPPILILAAENDEVIPPHVAGQLEQRGQEIGLDITKQVVLGAMHTECPIRSEGRDALISFILQHTGPRAGI